MCFNYGNFGYSYPMMNNYNYGFNNTIGNSNQYFKSKYGCEDCFKSQPYAFEYPRPIIPNNKKNMRPSLWKQFINRLLG